MIKIGLVSGRCKICGKEGSIFNMFDPYDLDLECHERCLEKELEKGNLGVLGGFAGLFE